MTAKRTSTLVRRGSLADLEHVGTMADFEGWAGIRLDIAVGAV
jgi:hypothetical protein